MNINYVDLENNFSHINPKLVTDSAVLLHVIILLKLLH